MRGFCRALFVIERNLVMEFLTRPITSERLEEKGQSLYKLGKIFSFVGLCGFGLIILIGIIATIIAPSEGFVNVITLNMSRLGRSYAFCIPIIIISYIGILLGMIGIPMYFNGLSIFVLGRIAHNTEKE